MKRTIAIDAQKAMEGEKIDMKNKLKILDISRLMKKHLPTKKVAIVESKDFIEESSLGYSGISSENYRYRGPRFSNNWY